MFPICHWPAIRPSHSWDPLCSWILISVKKRRENIFSILHLDFEYANVFSEHWMVDSNQMYFIKWNWFDKRDRAICLLESIIGTVHIVKPHLICMIRGLIAKLGCVCMCVLCTFQIKKRYTSTDKCKWTDSYNPQRSEIWSIRFKFCLLASFRYNEFFS